MHRFDKHMTADRPTNSTLHQENQQRLSQLIQERERMDMGQSVYEPTVTIMPIEPIATPIVTPIALTNAYTPWKTPSTLKVRF
jgi:hypothetical protein